MKSATITVTTTVNSDLDTVWRAWNNPDDIRQWNTASADWHTTAASVDLRVGGMFSSRMEAKDGSTGFDFAGIYTRVVPREVIEYEMTDGRAVNIQFQSNGDSVTVTETFDPDSVYDPELQRAGWQSILDNFARHVEAK